MSPSIACSFPQLKRRVRVRVLISNMIILGGNGLKRLRTTDVMEHKLKLKIDKYKVESYLMQEKIEKLIART